MQRDTTTSIITLSYLTYIIRIYINGNIYWKDVIDTFSTLAIKYTNQRNVNIFTMQIEVLDEVIHQYSYALLDDMSSIISSSWSLNWIQLQI